MHRASYRFMPPCGITETLSDVESVRVVHFYAHMLNIDGKIDAAKQFGAENC